MIATYYIVIKFPYINLIKHEHSLFFYHLKETVEYFSVS